MFANIFCSQYTTCRRQSECILFIRLIWMIYTLFWVFIASNNFEAFVKSETVWKTKIRSRAKNCFCFGSLRLHIETESSSLKWKLISLLFLRNFCFGFDNNWEKLGNEKFWTQKTVWFMRSKANSSWSEPTILCHRLASLGLQYVLNICLNNEHCFCWETKYPLSNIQFNRWVLSS